MSARSGLDLSALSQFKAADLLESGPAPWPSGDPGVPLQVALERIDLDPEQPRRRVRDDLIAELAGSIREHGVLEPVSLRRHPELAGRFIVNRGERRVRAARQAGLPAVPAFVDDRVDRFAQAVENLHREDMSPFDLADFIAHREREGYSRAEIARRLGRPRSFITEAARLCDAPPQLREASEAGRIGGDVRMLYQLAALAGEQPRRFEELLARGGALDRTQTRSRPLRPDSVSGGRTVLVVAHGERRGALRIKARDGNVGEVRFGDGTSALLPLMELRPLCWATEE